jgi:membrane protease subunit HflC
MNKLVAGVGVLVVIVLMVVGGAFYQVDETELVIITQFGDPVGDAITTPGLKVKAPFIQRVRRFEKRILEWDGSPDEIPTLDKRFIKLDTTARWRIVDPLQFLKAVKTERSAQSRLDDLIDSAARDVVSSHLLIESVRNFTRELPMDEVEASERRMSADLPADVSADVDAGTKPGAGAVPDAGQQQAVAPVPAPEVFILESGQERLGRDRLTQLMVERAQEKLPNFGIELIDVRIKSINYVQEVEQRVYERMISERQRIAARFRSIGDGESAKIRGEKEKEIDSLRSNAYRLAQEVIGKADAEAAGIYAASYGQAPEFYTFIQTLAAYKKTLKSNSSLLLTTDSDFYRYLNQANGLKSTEPTPNGLEPAAIMPEVAPAPMDGDGQASSGGPMGERTQ